jgi:septal ring factor EnvC (AmiA/AmiB activator)
LSTLTKILIILLALASIFLCGIVVTYVSQSENFKEQWTKVKSERDTAKASEENTKKKLSENIESTNQLKTQLESQLASMKTEVEGLQSGLKTLERDKNELSQKLVSMSGVVESSSQTAKQQTDLFEKAQDELNKIKEDQLKTSKELDEINTSLMEKMSIIQTLESDKKRLAEQKTELQAKLDQILRPSGKVAVTSEPVTPEKSIVKSSKSLVGAIALTGTITEVQAKKSMASISLGTADGVKEGMKFHVTRGDSFVCDVRIISVEAEQSVGTLELVQQQPKVGDTASTNF